MTAEKNEWIMRTYLEEVVGNGRVELIEKLADPDMTDHCAVSRGWGEGRAGLEEHVRRFHRGRENTELTVKRVIASETEVAGWWQARANLIEDAFGIRASGQAVEYSIVSFFKIRNGKIIDYDFVSDSLSVVEQLGAKIVSPNVHG